MNKKEITARIIELIQQWVITLDGYSVYWNQETVTFSSNGGMGGKEVSLEQLGPIIEKEIREPLYLYLCKDDGIVSFEKDTLIADFTEKDIKELYEHEMDGLFIGWD